MNGRRRAEPEIMLDPVLRGIGGVQIRGCRTESKDNSSESWDPELRQTADEALFELPAAQPSKGPWMVAAVLVLVAAVAAYVVFRGPGSEQTAVDAPKPSQSGTTQPIQPLGGDATPIVLPPLDESDALVADLVRKLSSHPRVTAWLTTDGLVRNFAVVVLNIAEGETPNQLLRPLRPSSGFLVSERNGDLFVDPRSYERYTPLAEAVASIDAKGAASLYTTLKPRIEDAHRELGELEAPFNRTLERALVMLLRTPVPGGPVRVEPRGNRLWLRRSEAGGDAGGAETTAAHGSRERARRSGQTSRDRARSRHSVRAPAADDAVIELTRAFRSTTTKNRALSPEPDLERSGGHGLTRRHGDAETHGEDGARAPSPQRGLQSDGIDRNANRS